MPNNRALVQRIVGWLLWPARALQRQFWSLFVNPECVGSELLGSVAGKRVCYVMQGRSRAERILLKQACRKLGFPLPERLRRENLGGKDIYVILGRPSFRWRNDENSDLSRLRHYLETSPITDLTLVPVAVYWGRAPHNEKSIWRLVFMRHWRPPNYIQRLHALLFNRQHITLHYGLPFSLQKAIGGRMDTVYARQKTERLLRVHFHRQRLATLGPDVSHRRTLIQQIIDSSSVQSAVQEARKESRKSASRLKATARKYALEIVAHKSYVVIRIADHAMRWFWKKIYRGINIYGSERVVSAAKYHELVYLPCHRSYIDSILLPYAIFLIGLDSPHIATGNNLNLPVVGQIMRRCGAWFVRRSGITPLYLKVSKAYLRLMLQRGFSIGFFAEGGRSRTGLLLSAKKGLLLMTLEIYLSSVRKPLAFVPLYFGYEKVMDGKSYSKELKGRKKQKETLPRFIKAIKGNFFKRNYGQVHVNFGEPIYLKDFLESRNPSAGSHTNPSDEMLNDVTRDLGEEAMTNINRSVVVLEVNLVSCCFASSPEKELSEEDLSEKIALLVSLIKGVPVSNTYVLAESRPEKILDRCRDLKVISFHAGPSKNYITLEEKEAGSPEWYKNNILHTLLLPSLVCLVCHSVEHPSRKTVFDICRLVYPYLKTEYHLTWTSDELEAALDRCCEVLDKIGILEANEEVVRVASKEAASSQKTQFIQSFSSRVLGLYLFTVRLVESHENNSIRIGNIRSYIELMDKKAFGHKVLTGHSDLKTIKNFIHGMVEDGLLELSDTRSLVKTHGFERMRACLDAINID